MRQFEASRYPSCPSPLRRARWHRNWTLDDVLSEIDQRVPGDGAGITPSLLSAWELGRHRTSARYRKVLCDLYDETPEVLFAHQDGGAWDTPLTRADGRASGTTEATQLRLLTSHRDLFDGMLQVVHEAEQCLVVTGSRSREVPYLEAIAGVLRQRPALVHYRILFGPPHHQVLKDHLLTLLELRDPNDRSLGYKTLHVGIVEDTVRRPERFFCACERSAVVIIPSLTVAEAFDSGIRFEGASAGSLVQHGIQAYAGARTIETVDSVSELAVVRALR